MDDSTPFPNRAQRRSAARKVAAAGSAAVLVSVAGTAAVTLSGSVAGAVATDVTTCANSGPGSLRAAILYANGHSGPDTITISATCTASSPVSVTSGMTVYEALTIVGPGAADFVLDGGDASRVLYVDSSEDFSLSGVTIQNAYYLNDGSALAVHRGADITISSVVFRDNYSGGQGGALYLANSGGSDVVTIVDCLFEGNSADSGGALYLANSGATVVSNSTFSDNHATSGGGGAISVYENPGTFELFNSTITGNTAGHGAALYLRGLYDHGTIMFNTIADNEGTFDDGVAIAYQLGVWVTFRGNIVASSDGGIVLYTSTPGNVSTYSNDLFGTLVNVTADALSLIHI